MDASIRPKVGQVWKYKDSAGDWKEFEIIEVSDLGWKWKDDHRTSTGFVPFETFESAVIVGQYIPADEEITKVEKPKKSIYDKQYDFFFKKR